MEIVNKEDLARLEKSSVKDAFHRNINGSLSKNDLTNTKQILRIMLKPYGDVLRYNEFSQQIEIVSAQTFQIGSFKIPIGALNDDFISALVSYADSQFTYQIKPDLAFAAIKDLAHAYSYNPLTDYLDFAFKDWDQKEHINGFMHKYLGVEQTDFNVRMFTLWLVEAVTKAYQPDSQADYVLLLQGGQGVGKTTFFKTLAVNAEWYTDSFNDFKNKDNFATMLGAWIVNDDEMTATKNSKISETKKFITQTTLQFREPYERTPRTFTKNFVIGMTTNEPTPLKDRTGSRRYLVLKPNRNKRTKDITNPYKKTELQNEIKQLWGEAANLYRNGYQCFLSLEEEKQLASIQTDFTSTDDISETLEDKLSGSKSGKHYSIRQLLDMVLEDLNQTYFRSKERTSIRNEIAMIMESKEDWHSANTGNDHGYTKTSD
ncbi:MAG: virulence-associated E family protein [Oenococcus oeni]